MVEKVSKRAEYILRSHSYTELNNLWKLQASDPIYQSL